jgi:hypothetical protein
MTARDLAKARYMEASAVEDAYASQVTKRRGVWRRAPEGKASSKARRELQDAVLQYNKARDDTHEAWRAWHALGASRK